MIALYCLTDYYDGVFRVKKLPFRIIFFLIGGLILGLVMWWTNEATYKGKAPPDDEDEAHIKWLEHRGAQRINFFSLCPSFCVRYG